MKKIIYLMVACVVFSFVATSCSATVGKPDMINSLAIARYLAENPIVEYAFEISYNDDNLDLFIVMNGRMSLKGLITQLNYTSYNRSDWASTSTIILNDGEGTLPGIPYPNVGLMKKCRVRISGVTEGYFRVGEGKNFYAILYPKEIVNITLNFDSVHKILDLDDLVGQPGDSVFIDGVRVGSWSSYYNSYKVWIDISSDIIKHTYRIYNNEQLVAVGMLNQFYEEIDDGSANQNGLDIQIEGGVILVGPESAQKSCFLDRYSVDEYGSMESARVFIIDASNGGWVSASNDDVINYCVLYTLRDGEMYEVSRDTGNFSCYIMPTKDRYILVVYGSGNEEFHFHFKGNTTFGGKG